MQSFMFFVMCIPLFHQSVWGSHFRNFIQAAPPFGRNYDDFSYFKNEIPNDTLAYISETSNMKNNVSESRTEQESSAELLTNGSSLQTNSPNSTVTISDPSQSLEYSTNNVPNTLSTNKVATLTEIFGNETNSSNTVQYSSSSSSSTTAGTTFSNSVTPTQRGTNESSSLTEDDEEEGVARGKPSSTEGINTTTPQPETLYQKTLKLINDTYTLSIVIPIGAGIVFASTIIVTIATCRCLNRRCRRRRVRRKTLPDSVKNLRPSDRARLLAESSDEEF